MANSRIIERLKQSVVRQLINNNEIVDVIDSPDKNNEDWSPYYLINSKETLEMGFTPAIYTSYKFPETINKNITFLCVLINETHGDDNNIIVDLHIVIFTHKDHMMLDDPSIPSNRNDYLSILIDEALNGKSLIYDEKNIFLGRIKLLSNIEDAHDNNFLMRHLIFRCYDINRNYCDSDD